MKRLRQLKMAIRGPGDRATRSRRSTLASAIDGGVGVLVWSPLAGGRLTGKYRRGRPAPAGACDEAQLVDNLAATELELSAEEVERLERISRPPLLYPYWHQAASLGDRTSPADRALLDNYAD